MCSRCHKRVAAVFITKIENGEKKNEGICLKCAKELGLPINNMLGDFADKMGITPDQLENMQESFDEMMENQNSGENLPSDNDDNEDGGAPAIDFTAIFRENGLTPDSNGETSNNNVPEIGNIPSKKKDSKEKEKKEKKYKFLDTYCRNLTKYAAEGKLDKIIGRERELNRVIQILCRRQKNNPCLIGEPGVGKTAIAEALAQKIATGDVPYKLINKEIYLVDLTALVAGTQFRGQFESRILGLLNEVREAGNIILVIDEVHNIVGTGDSEGSISAANILKPALSRGEVQVIGATTLNEYRKYIEKDSALERRFQPVTVNEPSIEDTVKMLKGIKHYYEEFHNIKIPEALLYRAVVLSERYITDRYLPDKAIDLLDEAASSLSLNSSVLNEAQEIRDKLINLKNRRTDIEADNTTEEKQQQANYENLAIIKSEEIKLSQRLKVLEPACETVELTAEDLADVIEIWTGVPATTIKANEFERIDHLEERLKQHIIGQDRAVEAITRAIKRNRAGISYKRKPVSFIFCGPTGVGKTELVKTLANDLFNSPETLIRLDMSEYMEKHSVSKIIGSPPGYVGYDEAGQLTEKIRRRPYSIILFDEIEKAHPDVLNVLLQILDDGRITDSHGKTVNFENTVIVMTTNAGSDNSANEAGFSASDITSSINKSEKALATFLRPEFLNRVDEVITFRSLNEEDFTKIAVIMLNELKTTLHEKGIELTYTDTLSAYIAKKSYSHKFGARNMRRYIQTHLEDKLAEIIVSDYKHKKTNMHVDVKDNVIVIE